MLETSAFIWNVPAIGGGDPDAIVNILNDGGFDRVAIKAANSTWIQQPSYYAYPGWGPNIRPELVVALKEAGIKLDVWHFVYGTDPVNELRVAKQVCDLIQPDVYIWNSESAFEKKLNRVANANYLSGQLKMTYPVVKQAICTWAFPLSPYDGRTWHPTDVIQAYLQHVDYAMPMMYWGGSMPTNAIKYYEDTLTVWRKIHRTVPIIPIGRAYDGDGGQATAPAMSAFKQHVLENATVDNLVGLNWYSLDEMVKNPAWIDAIRSVKQDPPPEELTDKEKLDRLVEHHSSLFS